MSVDVGRQLRAVRTAFGLSQRELAKRAGPGLRVEATGYLSNFRETVRPMRTGGVLVPERK